MSSSANTPAAMVQAGQGETIQGAAKAYAALGLSVLPLRGKRPALIEWKKYQQTAATIEEIDLWHRRGLLSNLGVICGAVSGNLVVLDFDGPGGYLAFCGVFPALAGSFTVATGSGQGQHVYLYVDALPPTTRALDTPIGHLELRAEGCYVVAPPSIHPVTGQAYRIMKESPILRVQEVSKLVAWIESFRAAELNPWQPPKALPPVNGSGVNPAVVAAIADSLRGGRHRERGEWINCSCPYPERHSHGDRNPSFGFNTASGFGHCYRCGTILAKDLCEVLGIDPVGLGGLMAKPDPQPLPARVAGPALLLPPPPPVEAPPPLDQIELPNWLRAYTGWASQVGNQTPELFHLGMGIWMAAVAIARRVYTDARWGVQVFPNLYMMFVADTTFYRKTTAYKLGERVLNASIPHLLMPTPGSPERFQDALAGQAPGNFNRLSQAHKQTVLESMRFAAQRGLFKDEIAGLFGAFKRDYMAGVRREAV